MIDLAELGVTSAADRVDACLEAAELVRRREQASELDARWQATLDPLQAAMQRANPNHTITGEPTHVRAASGWDSDVWSRADAAVGTASAAGLVRIGEFAWQNPFAADTPWRAPAFVPLIGHDNVVILGDPASDEVRGQLLCSLALRALAALPAGQLRLVLLDGAGVGRAFKPVMGLSEALRGPRVLTGGEHIARRLRELREDMTRIETDVLGSEYGDLAAYNADSPAALEPYRLVLVSGFPHGFERPALAELLRIATSGPSVGVHVVLDWRSTTPPEWQLDLSPLHRSSVILAETTTEVRLLTPPMPDGATLRLDGGPPAATLRALTQSVNDAATHARRIAVAVDDLYPRQPPWLSGGGERTDTDIVVPIGRRGPHERQLLQLGETTGTHHALIAGVTGRGKSVLLHALICGAALKYSPDELQFYLVDLKGGVEFQAYRKLPHARVLAIQSEREFGLSVLRAASDEIGAREELFRLHSVSSIGDYRRTTGLPLPRILVILDEFQKLFEVPDRIGDTARHLLDDIARRGRSQGLHLVLASQSLSGVDVKPSTFSQIQLRIGLQLGAQDAERVFARDNLDATRLERAGQAIYNAAGGQAGHNAEFQVVYIDNASAAALVGGMAAADHGFPAPLVFDGNRSARLADNAVLHALEPRQGAPLVAFFGEPVQLQAGHVQAPLHRRARANLLVCGGRPERGAAGLVLAAATCALGTPAGAVAFYLADSVPVDSPARRVLDGLPDVPGIVRAQRGADIEAMFAALAREVEARVARQERGLSLVDAQSLLLLVPAIQQLRILEPDGYRTSAATDNLVKLLRHGPDVGVHVLAAAQPLDALLHALGSNHAAGLGHFGVRLALDEPSLRRLLTGNPALFASREEFGFLHRVDSPDSAEKVRLYDPAEVASLGERLATRLATAPRSLADRSPP